MRPHDFEVTTNNATHDKHVSVKYECYIFYEVNTNESNYHDELDGKTTISNYYTKEYTCNPLEYFNNHKRYLNENLIQLYLDNYSIYDGTCEALENTYDHGLDYIDHLLSTNPSDTMTLREIVKSMEDFAFTIPDYQKLYKIMQKYISSTSIDSVKEYNTNLMTVASLNELLLEKPKLTRFQNKPLNTVKNSKPYSPLQKAAILDDGPLTLIQSGAGTGKSTVVQGRINHMIDCGVRPQDIIVLSFTNAAADHITELYPTVRSMTIASMIHSIYSANFPTHILSSETTLANMLKATVTATMERKILCKYLNKGDKMTISEFTAFYNFVSNNYDSVINMLTMVQQTTLLLEVLICAINMKNIQIPQDLTCKHMIVDEVQDNSMFEFIYMLKYTAYNHNSLFMVGDCSQTLYEFRLANPGTLNALEASGIFNTHVLDINYRSTQAILDFANVVLADIKANQYANIQLHANNLAKVDYNTFANTVHCDYYIMSKKSELNKSLPYIFAKPELQKFIQDALSNNEKLAILAYSRATANACKDIMESTYPNYKIASACSKITYDITILSHYVSNYWDDIVKYFNMQTLLSDICTDLMKHYSNPNGTSKQDVRNREIINKFGAAVNNTVQNYYIQYSAKLITKDMYLDAVKKLLIDFEIKNNQMRRRMTSMLNKQEKESSDVANANVITSTVHSVKGLEYDKCIIIYDDDAHDEPSKRLYYVALTRAMKGEYIIAYGKNKYSYIEETYNNILHKLDPNYVSQNIKVSINGESESEESA